MSVCHLHASMAPASAQEWTDTTAHVTLAMKAHTVKLVGIIVIMIYFELQMQFVQSNIESLVTRVRNQPTLHHC